MELECVFFSVIPILARTSSTSLLLTSSSRARSLIRTLCCCITPRSLRFLSRRLRLHSILTVQWPVASCQWSVTGKVNPNLTDGDERLAAERRPLVTGHRPLVTGHCLYDFCSPGFSSSGTFSLGASLRS